MQNDHHFPQFFFEVTFAKFHFKFWSTYRKSRLLGWRVNWWGCLLARTERVMGIALTYNSSTFIWTPVFAVWSRHITSAECRRQAATPIIEVISCNRRACQKWRRWGSSWSNGGRCAWSYGRGCAWSTHMIISNTNIHPRSPSKVRPWLIRTFI